MKCCSIENKIIMEERKGEENANEKLSSIDMPASNLLRAMSVDLSVEVETAEALQRAVCTLDDIYLSFRTARRCLAASK